MNPFGLWLRSSEVRRKTMEQEEKRYNSNPMNSPSNGKFIPISKAILKHLGRLANKAARYP